MAATAIRCVLIAVTSLLTGCDAGNHYCVNGCQMKLHLDDFYHRDEVLVPEIPDEPSHQRLEPKTCKWGIEVSSDQVGLQIVLQGLPIHGTSAGEAPVNSTAQLLTSFSDSPADEAFTAGMIHVQPLNHRKLLSSHVTWDPRSQQGSTVSLRVMVPVPGFCSRDMLSYHGSCHAIGPVTEQISDSVANMKGDVQLASFNSKSEMDEFVASNEAKQLEFPYRQPLDLTQQVRLGLFYRASDAQVLVAVGTPGGCELRPLDGGQKMLLTAAAVAGPCATLRASAGRAEVRFGDCESRTRVLMTFPETATSAAGSGVTRCNSSELMKLVKMLKDSFTKDGANPKLEVEKFGPKIIAVIAVSVMFFCIVFILFGYNVWSRDKATKSVSCITQGDDDCDSRSSIIDKV